MSCSACVGHEVQQGNLGLSPPSLLGLFHLASRCEIQHANILTDRNMYSTGAEEDILSETPAVIQETMQQNQNAQIAHPFYQPAKLQT